MRLDDIIYLTTREHHFNITLVTLHIHSYHCRIATTILKAIVRDKFSDV